MNKTDKFEPKKHDICDIQFLFQPVPIEILTGNRRELKKNDHFFGWFWFFSFFDNRTNNDHNRCQCNAMAVVIMVRYALLSSAVQVCVYGMKETQKLLEHILRLSFHGFIRTNGAKKRKNKEKRKKQRKNKKKDKKAVCKILPHTQ